MVADAIHARVPTLEMARVGGWMDVFSVLWFLEKGVW